MPPHLSAEVATALANGRHLLQIPDTGHLGFVERPEAANSREPKFFAGGQV